MVRVVWLSLLLPQLLYCGLRYLERTTVAQTSFESVSQVWSNPQDDTSIRVAIGFNFRFNNRTFNRIRINTNGALTFEADGYFDYRQQELPYKNNSIYPYWYDFNPQAGGVIRYGTLGSGANQRFAVTWENIPRYPDRGSYTIQAVLYQDGSIRFRYDAAGDASSQINQTGCEYWWICMGASIGVEESSSYYDQYSYNAPIDPTLDILYTPIKNINITKSSCVIHDPINAATNPKRIPNATIRYAIEVSNRGVAMSNVIVQDNLDTLFDYSTINYLQIQNGSCNCKGVSSISNNGTNGTGAGVHPIKLDFGTIANGSTNAPTIKCGYFEAKVR